MRTLRNSFLLSLVLAVTAFAQVPTATHLTILKAEDARRYDKTLETLLKSPNEKIRIRAALAVGRIGNDASIPALTELVEKDASVRVRETAAFAIGEVESIKGADAVLKTLASNPAPTVAARLVEAAGKIAGANATDAKTTELRTAILNVLDASDVKDRETILLGLTAALRSASRDAKRERPDRTDTVVAKFLTHSDARVRADAANTLARVRAKNANEILRRMLANEPDPIARANAARVLGAAEDKTAVDLLVKAATGDVDSRVRVSAIRSLAALRDAKAAEPLLKRGEDVLTAYERAKTETAIPAEHSEFLEIATALGRLLPNTGNERAVNLIRGFGKLDRGLSAEAYIARVRIAPRHGDNDKPEMTHWRQYSTLAQIVGEFASIEPTTDEGKKMKEEAPTMMRELAKAYSEVDPVKEADTIMAAPDVLRSYAAFKSSDLAEILRTALSNKDIFIRATAAELLAEQPVSDENLAALNAALDYAILNDAQYNDAVLAIIDALFKLDKKNSLPALATASGSLDHLVRAKVLDLLKDDALKDVELPPVLKNADQNHLREVRRYSGKFTKLGQVLNSDADYRRALARKNGTVKAVVATAKGEFAIDLLPEDAPLTVDNFIKLAREGYFNGLEVHRVVANFVMQDGDPRGDGNGGPGWSIRCEMNMVPYERGVVGMALSGKDTGGSQWFVTHSPQPHLDGGYTVFGRVNEANMPVVDKIVRGNKIVSVRIVEGALTPRSRRSQRGR